MRVALPVRTGLYIFTGRTPLNRAGGEGGYSEDYDEASSKQREPYITINEVNIAGMVGPQTRKGKIPHHVRFREACSIEG